MNITTVKEKTMLQKISNMLRKCVPFTSTGDTNIDLILMKDLKIYNFVKNVKSYFSMMKKNTI